jgi:hypothetical protein
MASIEIYLTRATPGVLYTVGALLDGAGRIVDGCDRVRAQLGSGDVQPVSSGVYTYRFGTDQRGELTVHVIDANTHASLQHPKSIVASDHVDGFTYSFLVP